MPNGNGRGLGGVETKIKYPSENFEVCLEQVGGIPQTRFFSLKKSLMRTLPRDIFRMPRAAPLVKLRHAMC
ncbi:hypothetical protein IB75_15885 [Nitrosococcus oceani C-27]|uniref:Uncharacterized protein n=1 Tax=Nitrosococcus oceani C-27 TaxID=314279 RepID=A0A0E2YXN5_9GAMM|nr:hypothetical protein IB75_15885 [Nitrosococcus oceani C-27]